jgi:hypothetical protein
MRTYGELADQHILGFEPGSELGRDLKGKSSIRGTGIRKDLSIEPLTVCSAPVDAVEKIEMLDGGP